ncbi:MAG: hypothetical protein MUO40_00125 [Anaerolineaceae bacterium]|nr:hypothetical protein [Anaerolineaceae bacterium]
MVSIRSVLLSPPIAMLFFMFLAIGIYVFGRTIAAKGKDEPSKFMSYTGGETLAPPDKNVSYRDFFGLALMFTILHVAGLVISTLPFSENVYWTALFFIFGIGVSVLVLKDIK